jgi:guanine deaminase
MVSPSAPHRCTTEFLQRSRRLADELALPVMTHCQETRLQIVTGDEFYGKSLVAYLDDIGFLKPDTTLIHGTWLSARDIARIAEAGATVQYNPWSNAVLGAGIAPVRACLDAGINVSLGTDGVGLPFGVSMLNALGTGAVLPKLAHPDPARWLTAADMFHAATAAGATALGWGARLGRLAVGMTADLVGYRLDSTTFTPLNDPVRQLVYAERGANLALAVVDGRVVMRDGTLQLVDETALLREAQAAHAALIDDLVASQADTAPFKGAIEAVYLKSLSCPIAHDHHAALLQGNNITAPEAV